MHIVIVGGGIAGLSSYVHLQKHLAFHPDLKITILERSDVAIDLSTAETTSRFRGGLGVAPNGLRVLRELDAGLYAKIKEQGYVVHEFEFRTSGARSLGFWPGSSTSEPELGTLMIDRTALWRILRVAVPDGAIRTGCKVASVDVDGSIQLESGETIEADIVIGADGVRSVVRQSVVDAGEPGQEPEFQLLMNLGGSMPTAYIEKYGKPSQCTMTFGSTGFVGYTPCSVDPSDPSKPGTESMWWSTFTADSATADRRTSNSPSDPSLVEGLKARHGNWSDPIIKHILSDLASPSDTPGDRKTSLDLYTPTWTLPKLPRWYRGRLVLIGDAAHALPSTSGQGISMALEDSVGISLVVEKLLGSDTTLGEVSGILDQQRVDKAFEAFQAVRKPRVEKILDDALRSQNSKRNLSYLDRGIMYAILWLLTHLMGKGSMAWKYDYDCAKELSKGL